MCLEDTDDDIIKMIKQHGQANGIRVMSAYIIHNRVCSDMVGCKITVPASQADRALSPDFWAKDIPCRIWENRRTRQTRQQQQQRGSDSRPRPKGRDDRAGSERGRGRGDNYRDNTERRGDPDYNRGRSWEAAGGSYDYTADDRANQCGWHGRDGHPSRDGEKDEWWEDQHRECDNDSELGYDDRQDY